MKNKDFLRIWGFIECILLISLSVVTMAQPQHELSEFIRFYGIAALVIGVTDIVLYAHLGQFTGFGPTVWLISAALSVMAGIMLIVYPTTGHLVLSFLFPLWFFAHSISRMVNLSPIRRSFSSFEYYFTMILNIAGFILGVLMLVRPWVSLFPVRTIVSIYLVLLGIDSALLVRGDGASQN